MLSLLLVLGFFMGASSLAFAFHAVLVGMYLHAERHVANAGCSNCKQRGIAHPCNGASAASLLFSRYGRKVHGHTTSSVACGIGEGHIDDLDRFHGSLRIDRGMKNNRARDIVLECFRRDGHDRGFDHTRGYAPGNTDLPRLRYEAAWGLQPRWFDSLVSQSTQLSSGASRLRWEVPTSHRSHSRIAHSALHVEHGNSLCSPSYRLTPPSLFLT
jgi:hypothetical protein